MKYLLDVNALIALGYNLLAPAKSNNSALATCDAGIPGAFLIP